MPSTPLGGPAEGLAEGEPERAPVRARTLVGGPAAPVSGPRPSDPAVGRPAGTLLFGGAEPAAAVAAAVEMEAEATAVGGIPLTRRCASCGERYPADFVVCPRDATPLADDAAQGDDPLVGRLLGETYQIVRVVGEGGMGRVYEARHLRLKERRFAVKVLQADLARNVEMAERFRREAETASSVRHPNVVDVFDVHQLPDGTPYFVGELLDGEELAALVRRRGALEPRLAVSVARQVAQALAAAHARGIVHRDMKPENVIATRASIEALEAGASRGLTVKVLDFGISKALGAEQTNLTRTGVIMGTPSYMAPEQARGQEVDSRADVYAVGAVLYFLLTARRPFDSDDPSATLALVLTQEPRRPRDLDARIPEALELVVQRAMAKEPRERFATMADLDDALSALDDVPRSSSPRTEPPVSGGPADVLGVARVIVGVHSLAPAAPAPEALVRAARPTILVTSVVLGAWLVAGTTAALAGLVRMLHDGELTLSECLLLVVGCLFAAATPAALYVGHVRRHVWPSSPRSVQLAADLKRTTVAVLVTYGALSVTLRIGLTVLLRSSRSLSNGGWDLLLLVVTLAAAVALGGLRPLLANFRRRRPRA